MLVVTCTCPMQSYVPIVHEPAKIQVPTRGKAVTPTKELLINSPKSRTNPPSPKDQLRYVIYVHTHTRKHTLPCFSILSQKKKNVSRTNVERFLPCSFSSPRFSHRFACLGMQSSRSRLSYLWRSVSRAKVILSICAHATARYCYFVNVRVCCIVNFSVFVTLTIRNRER